MTREGEGKAWWPGTGALARGRKDDVVLALHGFNCKNEHDKGMSDAPDGI